MSVEELAQRVRSAEFVKIVGSGTKNDFGLPTDGEAVSTLGLQGIISYEPDDRVVEVWAGTKISDLQETLAKQGQCLPMPPVAGFGQLLGGVPGTVGGLLSMNMPHGLYSQCGGPKEWTLGAKVIRAGGEVVKSGGKVVKNVAGFDFHRLVVGARGSLGLIVSVNLKVYPIKSVPAPKAEAIREWTTGQPLAIQRVLRADFDLARESVRSRLYAVDPASCTLWFEPESEVRRYESDWMMMANRGTLNLSFSEVESRLFRKVKNAVDPGLKFNRGVLGCL